MVTLWYRAPEILLANESWSKVSYTVAVDMWSLGCIFAEMANKNLAIFRGDSVYKQILLIFNMLGTPNSESHPEYPFLIYGDFQKYPYYPRKDLATQFPMMEPAGIDLLKVEKTIYKNSIFCSFCMCRGCLITILLQESVLTTLSSMNILKIFAVLMAALRLDRL